MEVNKRFNTLLVNITLTEEQKIDGNTKQTSVRTCLNSNYYNTTSSTNNSLLVGSWGKYTRIRPPRDIDILFILSPQVYTRIQKVSGNKQSYLLQEVKIILQKTFSTTDMRGDGQVIEVRFTTYNVEVVPAFLVQNGQYLICDTHNGGSYKRTDPNAEMKAVRESNDATNGNTRNLIRMMKCWQGWCDVPIKSFWIELLAISFLETWQYRTNSSVYYDWMTRDFLNYIIGRANSYEFAPGTSEIILFGNNWKSKAETAYARAVKACEYEAKKMPYSAGEEWQKIFGTYIPKG